MFWLRSIAHLRKSTQCLNVICLFDFNSLQTMIGWLFLEILLLFPARRQRGMLLMVLSDSQLRYWSHPR